MKKWLIFVSIFLSSYVVFLLTSAPLALVVNSSELPQNVKIQGVSGSVWQGKIERLTINNNIIERVNVEVGFWSLFSLSPRIDVSFGDAIIAGPEGKLSLTLSSQELTISEAELFISASYIANQLTLPIPIAAQGNVEVNFSSITLSLGDNLSCSQGEGNVTWLRAGVVALEQNIKLGKFNAELNCAQGNLVAKVTPDNNVGLSFDGVLALPSKRFTGQGFIKPGAKFPTELMAATKFLGRADNQGRYSIKL